MLHEISLILFNHGYFSGDFDEDVHADLEVANMNYYNVSVLIVAGGSRRTESFALKLDLKNGQEPF